MPVSSESPSVSSISPPHSPGPVRSVTRLADGVLLSFEVAGLRLRFLADDVLEARFAPGGTFSDGFSYALDPAATWEGPSTLEVEEGEEIVVRSGALAVHIGHETGWMSVSTLDGRLIQEDAAPPCWRHVEHEEVGPLTLTSISKRLRPGERLFGLGDKGGALDRRGHRFEHWNTNAFRYKRDTDPLYKSVPFVIGLGGGDGTEPIAYGLFVDSFAPSTFDLGSEAEDRLRVEVESNELVTYFFHAETPLGVIQRYAQLTGRTPMLPRWALGYHQSRYSYRTEGEVREVARAFRQRRIPCDTLYFDIHYMDEYRVFTWDPEAFPDPKGLLADLDRQGYTSVAIIDPGVKAHDPDYAVAAECVEKRLYVTFPNGAPFLGNVWPGTCYFPDFTRAEVRQWWGDQHRGLLADGLTGIWCDMNEPAVFVESAGGADFDSEHFPNPVRTMPDVLRHDCDGHPTDHRRAHNAYGMQMLRATYEGLKRLRPDRRPFTITRAAYAGAQRFGTGWTGDNSATWDHLRLAVEQCLSLNVSGMPFCGADVGGFIEEPSGELMARWTQLGVLTPLFRNHSAIDSPRQEPWLFGEEVERICREAIELRYRLLPTLYTALHEAAREGLPLMRPLALVHPADEAARDYPHAFYSGGALLAHPVVREGQERQTVYLPDGSEWFDFHSNERFEGGTVRTIDTPLERFPLFVKAGTVLPLGPVVQSTAELSDQPLTLRVYPAEGAFASLLYEDAGDGWDHENGAFYRCTFRGESSDERLTVTPEVEGSYAPGWSHWEVEVYGLNGEPRAVTVAGEATASSSEGGVVRFRAPVGAAFEITQ